MSAPDWKRRMTDKARRWMLAHPTASIAQTMKATGLSDSSISKIRREFREHGLAAARPHTPATQSTEELLNAGERPEPTAAPPNAEAILEGRVRMTRETRLVMLERIMRAGTPDQTIRANAEIERMERQSDEADEALSLLAPGTLEEAISDTADVVEALLDWGGEEAAEAAFKRAHTRWRQTTDRLEKQESLAEATSITLNPGGSDVLPDAAGTDTRSSDRPAVVDPPVVG